MPPFGKDIPITHMKGRLRRAVRAAWPTPDLTSWSYWGFIVDKPNPNDSITWARLTEGSFGEDFTHRPVEIALTPSLWGIR